MRALARRLIPASAALASLFLVIGCDPPKKTQKGEDRGILGKKTQDIRDAPTEAAKGGVETTPSIPVTDPITQSTKGLIFALERTSQLQVEHAGVVLARPQVPADVRGAAGLRFRPVLREVLLRSGGAPRAGRRASRSPRGRASGGARPTRRSGPVIDAAAIAPPPSRERGSGPTR